MIYAWRRIKCLSCNNNLPKEVWDCSYKNSTVDKIEKETEPSFLEVYF